MENKYFVFLPSPQSLKISGCFMLSKQYVAGDNFYKYVTDKSKIFYNANVHPKIERDQQLKSKITNRFNFLKIIIVDTKRISFL